MITRQEAFLRLLDVLTCTKDLNYFIHSSQEFSKTLCSQFTQMGKMRLWEGKEYTSLYLSAFRALGGCWGPKYSINICWTDEWASEWMNKWNKYPILVKKLNWRILKFGLIFVVLEYESWLRGRAGILMTISKPLCLQGLKCLSIE